MLNSSMSRRDALKNVLTKLAVGAASLPVVEAMSQGVIRANPLQAAQPEFESLVRARIPKESLFLHLGNTLGSMIELEDGSLLSVSSSGRSISSDGGTTWTAPEPLRDVKGRELPRRPENLVRLKSGGVGGFFHIAGEETKYGLSPWFSRSDDGGKSWSQFVRVGEPYNNAVMHDAIVTSKGRIVLPVYKLVGKVARQKGRALYRDRLVRVGHHSYELFFTYCWVYYSDNEGETWHTNKGKGVWGTGGELLVTLDYGAGGHYRCNEPVVAEVSPDHLLMFLRTPLGRLYQSWSDDDGTSWSRPEPTALASSLAPAALERIPGTDDLLAIWNQASAAEIEMGLQRFRLSSAVSKDGGATWKHGRNVFFQKEDDVTYVEPPPIRAYRAMEHAPRLAPNDLIATYPWVSFWKDRTIIRHRCEEISRLDWETYNRNYDRKSGSPEIELGISTSACIGLPTAWFYG